MKTQYKIYGIQQNTPKKEDHTGLPQKTGKISNKQPNISHKRI